VRALCSLWAYEALEASGALDAVSDTRRRAVVVGLRFMALVVCFAGVLFTLEALGDVPGMADVFADSAMGSISFYQMCYFIFVTISTVGYGDFCPKTVLGRAFAGVVITGGVAFFSVETSALVGIAQTEASGRGAFKPRRRRRHVLVCGGAVAAGGATLAEFLDELCAPGRGGGGSGGGGGGGGSAGGSSGAASGSGARGAAGAVPDAVVMCGREPSAALRELLKRPAVRRHARLLAASPLEAADLARARAASAAGAFVLADLCAADPAAEDEEAVLLALALHRACPRTPLTLLLNGRAGRALALSAGLPPGCCCAAEEVSGALLALAARAPGAATLACNLLRAPPPAPPREKHRAWHDQYLHGLAAGLHGGALGEARAAQARTFGALAAEAHARHGVVLLAHAPAAGGAPALSPPRATPLAPGDLLWGVAESAGAMAAALTADGDGDDGGAAPDWRDAFHARDAAARASEHAARDAALAAQRGAAGGASSAAERFAAAAAARRTCDAAGSAHAHVPADASADAVTDADADAVDAAGFSLPAAVHAVAERGGHVVVVNSGGDAWTHCEAVLAPLRRAYLPAAPALVLLSPAPPPRGLCARHGPHCVAVRGSASDAEAMLRAGVDTAASVLHLAGAAPPPGGEGAEEDAGGGGALDRRAVLSANILERHHEEWRRDVFLTLELRAPAAIKYLQEAVPRAHAQAAQQARPGGAAEAEAEAGDAVGDAAGAAGRARRLPGAAAAAAAAAALAAEVRELRELRALLNKGLLSGQGALNALLGTELALLGAFGDAPALPPVRASPALHARYAAGRAFFATDVCRAAAAAHFCPGALRLLARLADAGAGAGAQPPALWLVPLHAALAADADAAAAAAAPPPLAPGCDTFGALFATLAAAGVTPLGLYRQPRGGELPYVFAAPPPWVALARDDAVYVLASPGWVARRAPEYLHARQERAATALAAAWRGRAARRAARA
jgi:hypothetical protein